MYTTPTTTTWSWVLGGSTEQPTSTEHTRRLRILPRYIYLRWYGSSHHHQARLYLLVMIRPTPSATASCTGTLLLFGIFSALNYIMCTLPFAYLPASRCERAAVQILQRAESRTRPHYACILNPAGVPPRCICSCGLDETDWGATS